MKQELMETLEIFIGQLRQLFGLKPNYLGQDMDGMIKFIVSEKGDVAVSLVGLVIRNGPLPAPVTTLATICTSLHDTI